MREMDDSIRRASERKFSPLKVAYAAKEGRTTYLARGEHDIKTAVKDGWSVVELREGEYYSCDLCQESVKYPHVCFGFL